MSGLIEPHYDVVIVGGRPAGASLATRLGARGIPTLVIDRGRFPSPPAVPSCAFILPHTMGLIDELDVPESEFGDRSALARRVVLEFEGHFTTAYDVPELGGRDYLYGIDREHFDHALWRGLDRHPSVTKREQTSFLDVVRDSGGRVVGVTIKEAGGSTREVRARCVVGADGRFSSVARKAGAKVRERFDLTTTVHFASWRGVAPHDDQGDVTLSAYSFARGYQVIFFPAPGGLVRVCTHMRSDRFKTEGSLEDYYLRTVRSLCTARRRIESATRVSDIVGLKRIANCYREPGGLHWVLVGDAAFHTDPVDGQGIYDALLGSKVLAEELLSWHAGEKSFADAVTRYDRRMVELTHAMYEVATKRIEREIYQEPPAIALKTVIRWMMRDEKYKQKFLEYMYRTEPQAWLKPSVVAGAVARGMLGDLRRLLPPWR